jgi:ribonuclease Z
MSKYFSVILLFFIFSNTSCANTSETNDIAGTQVVMLGTGTPVPDPNRAGPGIAVVHNGKAYLFDTGAGIVRNAIKANMKLGIKALNPTNIEHVFYTHMHSDHINDFAELIQTVWWRKATKFQIYGPKEIVEMADGMYAMTAPDTRFRVNSIQPRIRDDSWQVDTHVIKKAGIVFENDGISIEAFVVPHGEFKPAFGYKIVTDDKTIVISGDTAFSETLIEKAKGADILLHEVISKEGLSSQTESWQNYHTAYHTPTDKVAETANRAKPKLLVLYHALFYGVSEETLLQEVTNLYDGPVVLADDLDIF